MRRRFIFGESFNLPRVSKQDKEAWLRRRQVVNARVDLLLDQQEAIKVELDQLIPQYSVLDDQLRMAIDQEMKLHGESIIADADLKALLPLSQTVTPKVDKVGSGF